MKTINELLIILKRECIIESINGELIYSGLCSAASNSYRQKDLIIKEEFYKLKEYILDNPPLKFEIKSFFGFSMHGYYWNTHLLKPRILWLDKHIKKTKL